MIWLTTILAHSVERISIPVKNVTVKMKIMKSSEIENLKM